VQATGGRRSTNGPGRSQDWINGSFSSLRLSAPQLVVCKLGMCYKRGGWWGYSAAAAHNVAQCSAQSWVQRGTYVKGKITKMRLG
jgi:hypothetical protein